MPSKDDRFPALGTDDCQSQPPFQQAPFTEKQIDLSTTFADQALIDVTQNTLESSGMKRQLLPMCGNRQYRSSTNPSARGFLCGAGKKMASDYPRNTGPMMSRPRCGARTRSEKPCRSPAVRGKRRCRMHGGAPGSGAPRGNKNALKHGRVYTQSYCGTSAIARPH